VTSTTTFVLTVTYLCKDDINEVLILTAPSNNALSYAAYSPSSSLSYGSFTLYASLNNCDLSSVTYTSTITPSIIGLSTSFISVDTDND